MSVKFAFEILSMQSGSMIAHLISLKVWKISGILGHVDTQRKTFLHYTLITLEQVLIHCSLLHHVIIAFKIQA